MKLIWPGKKWDGRLQVRFHIGQGMFKILLLSVKPFGFAWQTAHGRRPIHSIGWVLSAPFTIQREGY